MSNGRWETAARIGFLISHTAAHAVAVEDAIRKGRLPGCEVALVLTNVTGAAGLEAARAAGLQTVTLEGRGRTQQDHEEAIDTLLRRMRVEMICLAGYTRVLSTSFLRRWPARVLDVHSSLLPAFPRQDPVPAALAAGVKLTGSTVYFPDESIDGGVIVEQCAVPVLDEDTAETLAARVLAAEQQAYVTALERVLSGEYHLNGKRYVRRSGVPGAV